MKKHFCKCHPAPITIARGVYVLNVIYRNYIANVISENNRLNFLTKNALSMFRREMFNMHLSSLLEKKGILSLLSAIK